MTLARLTALCRRATLVVALGPVAGALAGSAAARAPISCSTSGYGLTQSITGRVSGCLQVGPLRPGSHTVVLRDILEVPQGAPVKRLPGGRRLPPIPAPSEPAVSLSLSPAAGTPGSWVTVTGRVAGRGRVRHQPGYPDFCWDGCANGLTFLAPNVRWPSARTFRVRLQVPAAPWVELGPARVLPLLSGTFPISVECVRSARGCASAPSEGSARFHLRVASPPAWCRTAASCARLHVASRAAEPGQRVAVTGYAPLVGSIGSHEAIQGSAQLLVLRSVAGAPEVRLHGGGGLERADFGRARLRIEAPSPFASLRGVRPVSVLTAGLGPIASDPVAPGTVAWCHGATLALAQEGETRMISTAGVPAALEAQGLGSAGAPGPDCTAAAVLGASPGAETVLAAFAAAPLRYGAPPIYDVALQTRDAGATWTAVPVPPGSSPLGFGGFRNGPAGSLQAVFSTAAASRSAGYPVLEPNRPLAETTLDGEHWTAGGLGCPALGPCLTLAPFEWARCAATSEPQPLLRSADGGVRWHETPLLGPIDACGPGELVRLAGGQELVVNTLSPFPLSRSRDGGRSWRDIGLPRLPFPVFGAQLGGLTLLSDGDLLLTRPRGDWRLLRAGAHAWCRARTAGAAEPRTPLLASPTVLGDQLWWLSGSAGSPMAESVPVASVSC